MLTRHQVLFTQLGLIFLTAICTFEFIYLLVTNIAWAVVPFGIGIVSVFGIFFADELEENEKR